MFSQSVRFVRSAPSAAVAAWLVFGLLAAPAMADTLSYETGFEGPIFKPGYVDGQDGWMNPSKIGFVLPLRPAEGTRSVIVPGVLLRELYDGVVGVAFGPPVFFDAAESGTVGCGVDTALRGPRTRDDLASANLMPLLISEDKQEVFYVGEAWLSSNGEVFVTDEKGNLVTSIPVSRAYHRLGAVLDFNRNRIAWYVDGDKVAVVKVKMPSTVFAIADVGMLAVDGHRFIKPAYYLAQFDRYCVASGDGATACARSGGQIIK